MPLTINLEQMFLENITCETLLTPVQGEAVNTSSFLFYFHFLCSFLNFYFLEGALSYLEGELYLKGIIPGTNDKNNTVGFGMDQNLLQKK